jgi:hypothetical protein
MPQAMRLRGVERNRPAFDQRLRNVEPRRGALAQLLSPLSRPA